MKDYPLPLTEFEEKLSITETLRNYLFKLRWQMDSDVLVTKIDKNGLFVMCIINVTNVNPSNI